MKRKGDLIPYDVFKKKLEDKQFKEKYPDLDTSAPALSRFNCPNCNSDKVHIHPDQTAWCLECDYSWNLNEPPPKASANEISSEDFPLPNRLYEKLLRTMECPLCKGKLLKDDSGLYCTNCSWNEEMHSWNKSASKNMSLQELSQVLNIPFGTLKNWSNSKSFPRPVHNQNDLFLYDFEEVNNWITQKSINPEQKMNWMPKDHTDISNPEHAVEGPILKNLPPEEFFGIEEIPEGAGFNDMRTPKNLRDKKKEEDLDWEDVGIPMRNPWDQFEVDSRYVPWTDLNSNEKKALEILILEEYPIASDLALGVLNNKYNISTLVNDIKGFVEGRERLHSVNWDKIAEILLIEAEDEIVPGDTTFPESWVVANQLPLFHHMTREELDEARNWLIDLYWADDFADEEDKYEWFQNLPDHIIAAAINKEYEGGIEAFIRNGAANPGFDLSLFSYLEQAWVGGDSETFKDIANLIAQQTGLPLPDIIDYFKANYKTSQVELLPCAIEIEEEEWISIPLPVEDPFTIPEVWPDPVEEPSPEKAPEKTPEREPVPASVKIAEEEPAFKHLPKKEVSELFGWKILRYDDNGTMYSPSQGDEWPVGVFEAKNWGERYQSGDNVRGQPGIHVVAESRFDELRQYARYDSTVLVKVACYGEAAGKTNDGFCVQFAKPIYVTGLDPDILAKIELKYGVETELYSDNFTHKEWENGWKILGPGGIFGDQIKANSVFSLISPEGNKTTIQLKDGDIASIEGNGIFAASPEESTWKINNAETQHYLTDYFSSSNMSWSYEKPKSSTPNKEIRQPKSYFVNSNNLLELNIWDFADNAITESDSGNTTRSDERDKLGLYWYSPKIWIDPPQPLAFPHNEWERIFNYMLENSSQIQNTNFINEVSKALIEIPRFMESQEWQDWDGDFEQFLTTHLQYGRSMIESLRSTPSEGFEWNEYFINTIDAISRQPLQGQEQMQIAKTADYFYDWQGYYPDDGSLDDGRVKPTGPSPAYINTPRRCEECGEPSPPGHFINLDEYKRRDPLLCEKCRQRKEITPNQGYDYPMEYDEIGPMHSPWHVLNAFDPRPEFDPALVPNVSHESAYRQILNMGYRVLATKSYGEGEQAAFDAHRPGEPRLVRGPVAPKEVAMAALLGVIKNPRVGKVFNFTDKNGYAYSTGELYDLSQTSDEIADGDILVSMDERVVGILVEAWPVAVTQYSGEFHGPLAEIDWLTLENGKYARSFEEAKSAIDDLNRAYGGNQFKLYDPQMKLFNDQVGELPPDEEWGQFESKKSTFANTKTRDVYLELLSDNESINLVFGWIAEGWDTPNLAIKIRDYYEGGDDIDWMEIAQLLKTEYQAHGDYMDNSSSGLTVPSEWTSKTASFSSTLDDARQELKQRVMENQITSDSEVGDEIHEIADSSVPVYYSELIEFAHENNQLLLDTPELEVDDPSPIRIIMLNVYEAIMSDLWEYWRDELEDEALEGFVGEYETEVMDEDESGQFSMPEEWLGYESRASSDSPLGTDIMYFTDKFDPSGYNMSWIDKGEPASINTFRLKNRRFRYNPEDFTPFHEHKDFLDKTSL